MTPPLSTISLVSGKEAYNDFVTLTKVGVICAMNPNENYHEDFRIPFEWSTGYETNHFCLEI